MAQPVADPAVIASAGSGTGADPLDVLARLRVVPVVEVPSLDAADVLADALLAAELPIVEVTLRTDAALEVIAKLRRERPGLLVGAGTVLEPAQVDAAAAAGAAFLVAPGFDPAVCARAQSANVPMLPGVATPSEIGAARAAGFRTLKLFPAAALGGPAWISAVAAPFRDVRFVPTGGIGPDTLADYLALPSVVAVGGTWIARADALRAGDVDGIRARASAALRIAAPAS